MASPSPPSPLNLKNMGSGSSYGFLGIRTSSMSEESPKTYENVHFSRLQGLRESQEDFYSYQKLEDGCAFAVIDGHGGTAMAEYCKDFLLLNLEKCLFENASAEEALKQCFISTERNAKDIMMNREETCGACAVVALLWRNRIYIASLGDCSAYILKDSSIEELSVSHYPCDSDETKRILNAGLNVYHGRVNGEINVSRAIGDYDLKKCPKTDLNNEETDAISCIPFLNSIEKTSDCKGILLLSK